MRIKHKVLRSTELVVFVHPRNVDSDGFIVGLTAEEEQKMVQMPDVDVICDSELELDVEPDPESEPELTAESDAESAVESEAKPEPEATKPALRGRPPKRG